MLQLETESDLKLLQVNEIEEGLTLEFKRELDLGDRPKKAEVAKDVSALANAVGGQIIFGVDETERADGAKIAGAIVPLVDAELPDRLRDALNSSIHPRPRFNLRRIDVPGGYALVADVFPSLGNDLHMVTGFKDLRFHKRNSNGTFVMSEPEIRESYMRIALSRQALDATIESAIASEIQHVPAMQESVFVVPWFGHRDLINPQRLGLQFGNELATGFYDMHWIAELSALRICSDGYRTFGGDPDLYAAIRRSGIVHFATRRFPVPEERTMHVLMTRAFETIVAATLTGRTVLSRCNYWGPVRLIYRLGLNRAFLLIDPEAQAAGLRVDQEADNGRRLSARCG